MGGLMQERHNSIASGLEFCLSCTKLSIYGIFCTTIQYSTFPYKGTPACEPFDVFSVL